MESINDRLRRKYEGAYLDKTWATGGDGNSPRFLSADAGLASLLHCSVSPYLYSGSQQAESPWPLHRQESGDLPKVSKLSSERPS